MCYNNLDVGTLCPIMKENQSLMVYCVSAGKTLSYAVPVVQSLQAVQPKISRSDGPLAVVIVPTREVKYLFSSALFC